MSINLVTQPDRDKLAPFSWPIFSWVGTTRKLWIHLNKKWKILVLHLLFRKHVLRKFTRQMHPRLLNCCRCTMNRACPWCLLSATFLMCASDESQMRTKLNLPKHTQVVVLFVDPRAYLCLIVCNRASRIPHSIGSRFESRVSLTRRRSLPKRISGKRKTECSEKK